MARLRLRRFKSAAHCAGFNIIDQPRPHAVDADDMSVYHGGVIIVAAADVAL